MTINFYFIGIQMCYEHKTHERKNVENCKMSKFIKGVHARHKVALVGFKNVTAGALAYYLSNAHDTDVIIVERINMQTDLDELMSANSLVILLEARNHSLQDIEAYKKSISDKGRVKLVVYCEDFEPRFANKAISRGADGIIDAECDISSIISILELIANNQVFAPVRILGTKSELGAKKSSVDYDLDSFQISTLKMVSKGQTNKEIAMELGMSETQIKMLVRNICKTLDAKNRAHAVSKVFTLGILK